MSNRLVYLDNINTTIPDDNVIASMYDVMRAQLGNPSSHIHSAGINAARVIEEARVKVAKYIGANTDEIIFVSGATEANNLAINGFLKANPDYQLAVLSIEHFSIINQARNESIGGRKVCFIDVDKSGSADLNQLETFLKSASTLVSIAYANPEIGTIQDINKIGKICTENGGVFHCDATAAAVSQKIDVKSMAIDLLTLSSHNMYGPTGIGALYIRDGLAISPLFQGGNQERGIRPGTENVIGIAGFGKACELVLESRDKWSGIMKELGDNLCRGLVAKIPFMHITGHPEQRLPGHISFWIEHIEGESLLLMLNMKRVMAASGSACSSNLKGLNEEDLVSSHVLSAVGVPSDICAGSLTFSLGKYNTMNDVNYVIDIMPEIVEKLLAMSPSFSDYRKKKESSNG